MLDILQGVALDLVRLPKDVRAETRKIDNTVVVVVDEANYETGLCLPGSFLIDGKYRAYGISTPDQNILVVLDDGIDGDFIEEDFRYFVEAVIEYGVFDSMRHLTLEADEFYRPISSLVHIANSKEHESVIEYVSALNGGAVFVKKNSNRHKFITGEANFLDDPYDFYDYKDNTVTHNNIESYADSKGMSVHYYMFEKLNTVPLKACLTWFADPEIKRIAENALKLRAKVSIKLDEDDYWENFEEPHPVLDGYKDINFDKVETALKKFKGNPETFSDIAKELAVREDEYKWGSYAIHFFFMFYILIDEDKAEFIKNSFFR